MRLPLAVAALALGCASAPPAGPRVAAEPADARVLRIADEYLARFFERQPEYATLAGWTAADHGAVFDPSLAALAPWQAFEDDVSARLHAVDPRSLGDLARTTRAMVLEAVDSSRGFRACRSELWDVSSTWGWQSDVPQVGEAQPVGTPELRRKALARLRGWARTVDARIADLREGLRLGYIASRENAAAVVSEVDGLLATPPRDSPFVRPAAKDGDPTFRAEMERAAVEELVPALRRYRDFLAKEYAPRARPLPGVAGLPWGPACYTAAVRRFVTLDVPAATIHQTGLSEMARIRGEMEAIARRSFGSGDVSAVLKRLRTDPAYQFRSPDEIRAAAQGAIDRAWAAAPRWFARLPTSRVRVEPIPEFQRATAPADHYSPPTEGNGHMGVYWVNAFVPPSRSRAGLESSAFHETVPGHHLQGALALEAAEVPVGRWLWNSAYDEGWALYSERLAREMGLYSTDVDVMGQLSDEAHRAARLVVDSGMHAMGWPRQRCIDYMLENTTLSPQKAASETDRYAALPGQAVAYLLGALEIRRLRAEAERALGPRFDVRAFHDAVLSSGPLPLAELRERIGAWIAAGGQPPRSAAR
jgi:uncharacterized protein (DUF885 family)